MSYSLGCGCQCIVQGHTRRIGLITVFDAILTGRKSGQKFSFYASSISLASLFPSLSIFFCFWLRSNLSLILLKPAAFSFAVLCIIVFRLFIIWEAVGLCRSDMLFFLTWFGHDFSAGQFLSVRSLLSLPRRRSQACGEERVTSLRTSAWEATVSLSRQWHDILDFSYCPLSRVLHTTLANLHGFEFHLRSSPSTFKWISGRSTDYLFTCYTVLTRPPGGGTPIYGLYRYVPRNRVWFLRFSVLKQGILFDPLVTVFLVWSFDRVAKLYYLILECKNAPLN